MSRRVQAGLFVLFFVALIAPAAAQTRLFRDSSEIQIVFEAPMGALVRNAPRSTDQYPAVATITTGGAPERFNIQLGAGGLSRRTGGICTFPPLRLNFHGAATRGTIMQGQSRLKLVTRCRNPAAYEQLTVLEYTAYRLYNQITPLSFRVRPARVTYRDTDGRRREETQFNFLIEDVDDVAHRNNRVALELPDNGVPSSGLDPQAATNFALFAFMIGNLDWDMVNSNAGQECCHNSKLMAATQQTRIAVAAVPYDFDYSGFVNAPYALPPDGLGVANVRVRLYRGYCRYNDQLPAAVARFRTQREALLAVIANETRLSQSSRNSARDYIQSFFAILDDPQRYQHQIVERCRR